MSDGTYMPTWHQSAEETETWLLEFPHGAGFASLKLMKGGTDFSASWEYHDRHTDEHVSSAFQFSLAETNDKERLVADAKRYAYQELMNQLP